MYCVLVLAGWRNMSLFFYFYFYFYFYVYFNNYFLYCWLEKRWYHKSYEVLSITAYLSRRRMIPVHTFVPGPKCSCGSPLGDSGSDASSACNKDRSLHTTHNTVLRTLDKAARSHGLNTTLELSSFSSPHDLLSDKRSDTSTAKTLLKS